MNAIIIFGRFDMWNPIHRVTEMFENRIDSLSANERPTPSWKRLSCAAHTVHHPNLQSDKLIWQQRKGRKSSDFIHKTFNCLLCFDWIDLHWRWMTEKTREWRSKKLQEKKMASEKSVGRNIVLALIGLFKLRLKKVKNRTPVMCLRAGYDEKFRAQYALFFQILCRT